MKYLVRESKVDTRKDLIRRTVDKDTCTNEQDTPRRILITRSGVKEARMCVESIWCISRQTILE
jgi:hypothetical protein